MTPAEVLMGGVGEHNAGDVRTFALPVLETLSSEYLWLVNPVTRENYQPRKINVSERRMIGTQYGFDSERVSGIEIPAVSFRETSWFTALQMAIVKRVFEEDHSLDGLMSLFGIDRERLGLSGEGRGTKIAGADIVLESVSPPTRLHLMPANVAEGLRPVDLTVIGMVDTAGLARLDTYAERERREGVCLVILAQVPKEPAYALVLSNPWKNNITEVKRIGVRDISSYRDNANLFVVRVN